ncbi:MAG: hypothetical protein HQK52_22045 [Oligoflexia bacterium]|nr:hypothetical protein [Oligoflexia bacterium]
MIRILISFCFLLTLLSTIQFSIANEALYKQKIMLCKKAMNAKNYSQIYDLFNDKDGVLSIQLKGYMTLADMKLYLETLRYLGKFKEAKEYVDKVINNDEKYVQKFIDQDKTALEISSISDQLIVDLRSKTVDPLPESIKSIKANLAKIASPLTKDSLEIFQQKIINPLLVYLEKNDSLATKQLFSDTERKLIAEFLALKGITDCAASSIPTNPPSCASSEYPVISESNSTIAFTDEYIKLFKEQYKVDIAARNNSLRWEQLIRNDDGTVTFFNPFYVWRGKKFPFSADSDANAVANFLGLPSAAEEDAIETCKSSSGATTDTFLYRNSCEPKKQQSEQLIQTITCKLLSPADIMKQLGTIETKVNNSQAVKALVDAFRLPPTAPTKSNEITFKSGAKYVGENIIVNGAAVPNGKGVMYRPDSTRYEGTFKDGQPHGAITCYDPKGGHDERTYDKGILLSTKLNDGIKYEGAITIDPEKKIRGTGTITYPNGEKFEGEFANSLPNGKGVHYSIDHLAYDGTFENGHKDGQFTITYPDKSKEYRTYTKNKLAAIKLNDGTAYEGEVTINDKKITGSGSITYPDGRKYEGKFVNSNQNGQGRLLDKEHRSLFEGEWKDGKMFTGKGMTYDLNGAGTPREYKNGVLIPPNEITYGDGSKYTGEIKDGRPNGKGVLNAKDSVRYIGSFKDGQKQGAFTVNYPDGSSNIQNYTDGKLVSIKFPDNSIYEGDWSNHKKNGKGTLHYANGARYVGDWKDNKRNGKGTLYHVDGERYDGEWKDGSENGKGTRCYANGNRYDGEWKDGYPNGKCTHYYANGDRYEGEWKDFRMNGKGTYYFINGDRYDGDWKDHKQHGNGTFYVKNGNRYEGEWKDGNINGKGTYYYAEGAKYEGEWKDGYENGKGTYYFANNEKFEGEWEDGRPHGKGTYDFNSSPSHKYEGEWRSGFKTNGKYTTYHLNDRFDFEFKDDENVTGFCLNGKRTNPFTCRVQIPNIRDIPAFFCDRYHKPECSWRGRRLPEPSPLKAPAYSLRIFTDPVFRQIQGL